jgi:hypothetical protein
MGDCKEQNISYDAEDIGAKDDLVLSATIVGIFSELPTGPRTDHLSENHAIVRKTMAPQRYTGMVK